MKIRNRLSIQFTALVASILLVFCVAIYYVTFLQIQKDFFDQLRDRTFTTAYMFLEEDELPPDIFDTIRQRFMRSLSGEIAQLYDMKNNIRFLAESGEVEYSDELVNFIRDNEYHEFIDGERQAVGIFYRDNQGDFVVIVSAINTIGQAHLSNLMWVLVSGFFFSVIVLFVAGRFFAAQSLRPIPRVVHQVNQISASNLHLRLDNGGNQDEIGELASTFNLLLDRLEENFRMQQRFVANASHELRTPLTSVIGEIEVTLTRKREVAEYEEVLQSILNDALTLQELTNGLLDLAQAESEKLNEMLNPVRVDETVIEASGLIEKKYPGSKIIINYSDEPETSDQNSNKTKPASYEIPAGRSLLLNVFMNVLDNAVKFSPDSPTAEVVLRSTPATIQVTIRDNGIGIGQEELVSVFTPFYRGKNALTFKGYGIGLPLVKRILTILNGSIEISSSTSSGTEVTIRFNR